MRRFPALLVVLAFACAEPTAPPEEAERFAPPAVYRIWFSEMQVCSGLRGDFDNIEWYAVPNLWPVDGGSAAGQFFPPRSIYLSRTRLDDRNAVAHEMLHFLEQPEWHGPAFAACEIPIRLPVG